MELTRAKITTFFGKLLRPLPCFSARTIYFSSSIVNCNHHIAFFDLFLYLCSQKRIRTRRFGYIDKGLVWSVCLPDLSSWSASFSFNPNHSCLFVDLNAVVVPLRNQPFASVFLPCVQVSWLLFSFHDSERKSFVISAAEVNCFKLRSTTGWSSVDSLCITNMSLRFSVAKLRSVHGTIDLCQYHSSESSLF